MLTTWQTVNRKNYFFDEKKGYMYTGWITTTAGNKYYFWEGWCDPFRFPKSRKQDILFLR